MSKSHSQSPQKKNSEKVQAVYHMGPDLHLTKHYFYLQSTEKNLSASYAVWNLCITEARRPSLCLIICQSHAQVNQILSTCKLTRKHVVITQDSQQTVGGALEKEKVEIVITTDKKISIMCSMDQVSPEFNVIMNIGFHKDPEYYRKIHSFMIKKGGVTISFPDARRDLERIQTTTGLFFKEISADLTSQDEKKELISSIQLMPPPKIETLSLIKMLPYSAEDCFARMFQYFQTQFHAKKSKHLELPGYITYQLKTSVEFNSLKYIWNYLSQLPDKIRTNIKGMAKFTNSRGVVFDIPEIYKTEIEDFIAKQEKYIQKHKIKDRKYWLQKLQCMPEIEDVNSESYKKKEEQIEFAMKNKDNLQLFVGGLPTTSGEHEIRELFTKNGVNILTVRILRDRYGESKGVCFILCANFQDSKKALQMNESMFGDKKIRVHLAEKKEDKMRERSRQKNRKDKHHHRDSKDSRRRDRDRSNSHDHKHKKRRSEHW